MTIPSEIRDLIEKLKAMTFSPNINEAAVAAAKLQSLLLKHNLSAYQFNEQRSDEVEYERRIETEVGAMTWRSTLLHQISKHNGCYSFKSPKDKTLTVVGPPDNVQVVWFIYDYVSAEIHRLCEVDITQRKSQERMRTPDIKIWKKSFCYGCVETIAARLKEQQSSDLDESGDSRSLVIRQQQDLTDALKRLFPDSLFSTPRSRRTYFPDADRNGKEAAKGISLEKQVPSGRLALGDGR